MKRWLAAIVLVVMANFTLSAAALTVKSAQYLLGYAVVTGTATPGASIYWEGAKVATASSTGYFAFLSVMPWDCVGTLSDGTQKISVIVKTAIPLSQCRPAAPVPQTGQRTTYTPGDDGDLEAGVVLPTPRFTDNGDGTIRDNLTNLIWLKKANCPAAAAASQPDAMAAIAQLNATGKMNGHDCGDLGLHKDWRLPNIKELESLVNYGFANPAMSSASGVANASQNDPFTDLQIWYGYWSSTTLANDPTMGWGITFSPPFNYMVNTGGKTFAGYVMAVRGGTIF